MNNVKKVVILGGGTFSHIRNHLALAMPAFGETARILDTLCMKRFPFDMDVETYLTKMASHHSNIVTNEDVEIFVNERIIPDTSVKVVFFNVALCDFGGTVDDETSGKYEPRLKSNVGRLYNINLYPTEKLVGEIRKTRKDIFLVAFKTTCGATEDEQYLAGLNLLKSNSCNLVLANDTKTRINMIITPEEARYHVTTDRNKVLTQLVDMAYLRSQLTFTRSTVVSGEPIPWSSSLVPASLREVVNYCVKRGAYKPFRGATVGHFACKVPYEDPIVTLNKDGKARNYFLTSIRKSNFNDIENTGLVLIETDGPDSVLAYGARPSVGGQSQRIVFSEHEGFDCIVHFHCPIKPGSKVPQVSQREYECGSHECGKNTSNGLAEFNLRPYRKGEYTLKAVYLKEHGPNIVFNRNTPSALVIKFIEDNFDLTGKTGGYVNDTKLVMED